jgi:hypothetical protein
VVAEATTWSHRLHGRDDDLIKNTQGSQKYNEERREAQ